MTENQLRRIFEKTKGHCHFCGDRIVFEKRGGKRVQDSKGYWEVDHVIQRAKGGASSIDNYLPACTRCNKLRWHRKGENLRQLLVLGLIAQAEIKKHSQVGTALAGLRIQRAEENKRRRKSRNEIE